MAQLLTTELKSDLENIYKKTGDMLNLIDKTDFSGESEKLQELMRLISFRLMDIEGTLQKDIFNCDYLITKFKTMDTERT